MSRETFALRIFTVAKKGYSSSLSETPGISIFEMNIE